MKKTNSYTVRISHFANKWIAESPRGISTQHDTKADAILYSLQRARKIIYQQTLLTPRPHENKTNSPDVG